jgi:hypothetical protein
LHFLWLHFLFLIVIFLFLLLFFERCLTAHCAQVGGHSGAIQKLLG